MSTDTIGNLDPAMRRNTSSNGALTGPLNEKPKMASRMTSEERNASERDEVSVEGGSVWIFILSHCTWRRCCREQYLTPPSAFSGRNTHFIYILRTWLIATNRQDFSKLKHMISPTLGIYTTGLYPNKPTKIPSLWFSKNIGSILT
jgi:hypothetical protein